MSVLSPQAFESFYEEIHGRAPYEWQARAARALVNGEEWDTLVAPTGAGKTTLVECFVFALACSLRAVPRRLFWVIDRRAVADEVHRHACAIRDALATPTGDVVKAVAARLCVHGGGEQPLEVRLWRGGLADDPEVRGPREALSPAAPAVVCSTVDQIGSRLLFRGYGVSARSRPIEAGIVGIDSLIVLDEAHLSEPFLQTLAAVHKRQAAHEHPQRPSRTIAVTATPSSNGSQSVFELSDDERAEERLAKRLRAHKWVTLESGRRPEAALIRAAQRLASEGNTVIGAIANTVTSARAIADALRAAGEVLLLIGPCRPIDRDGLIARIPDRAARAGCDQPLFVVGTQTLEVGLDLDLDGLVSACAPFASLVQRFGRLDRAGELGESHGVIVAPPPRCPVYGEATASTWRWLQDRATDGRLDLGPVAVAALRKFDPPDPPEQPQAPLLGPWHVEALVQTTLEPHPSPEVGVFLHGERALEAADVQVAWRADLATDEPDQWADRVRARPPHAGELLSLPIAAVRRWLDGQEIVAFADLEGSDVETLGGETREPRPVLRVLPPDPDGELTIELLRNSRHVRPGDVLVVPASYGGCDGFGWAPDRSTPVDDYGNFAPRQPVLLASELGVPLELTERAGATLAELREDAISEVDAYASLVDDVQQWLASGAGYPQGSSARAPAETITLARTGRVNVTPRLHAPGAHLILVPRRAAGGRGASRQVRYHEHVGGVESRVVAHARALDLPDALLETLRLAARYHDVGKLDPRFQRWLHDGMPPSTKRDLALAKSGTTNPRRIREAREASGWPRGLRHEAISAALVAGVERWPDGTDPDLIAHLVATHHGDARPLRRVTDDSDPVTVSVEIEGTLVSIASNELEPWGRHAERFVELMNRHGPWGLAALEAVLVHADRSVSAEEET